MKTVEELREEWVESLTFEMSGMLRGMSADLDSLLVEAEARGFEKGRAGEKAG